MKLIILLIIFVTASHGQYLNVNWLDNLMGSINQLNRNIQTNVQNLNQQIQNSVRQSIDDIDAYNQKVAERLHQIRTPITSSAMKQMSNGQTVIIHSGSGNSNFILSGHDANGKFYYRTIEEQVVNNMLRHIEKVYNSTDDKIETIGYTLDLSTPGAVPVPIKIN